MVKRLDLFHRVTVEPFQKPGLPEMMGLSIAVCEQMAWAVTKDLQKLGGTAAVIMAWAVAWGIRLPLWLYSLPGVHQVQDWIYDWVVRNRHRLPGHMPYCEEYPQKCG